VRRRRPPQFRNAGPRPFPASGCVTQERHSPMSEIRKVGVIGAGTMGNGIAQACAMVGLDAVMVDVAEAAVLRGLSTVSGSLDRLVKKERLTVADKDAALKRIKGTTDYDALKDCDFVIEACTENEAIK